MRKHKLTKTSKSNIYELIARDGSKNYIVRFSYLNKNYGEKNFTKYFGCRTVKQAFDTLQEVKVMLSKGLNPFEKKILMTVNNYFDEYIKKLKGDHKYITTKYYGKHIKPIIGDRDIRDIEKKHIEKILSGSLAELSDRSKNTLKVILNPIFKKSIKDQKRADNPLEDIKFVKPKQRRELTYRVVNSLQDTVKELYKRILKISDKELKAVYLIGLMTGRRRGEILGLKYKDIKGQKVFVPESITKTSIVDEFPMPNEILQIIDTFPKNRDHIFTIKKDRVTRGFTKLVNESDIELSEGSKLTFHDTRHLFQSIMIPITLNPPLVDRCLSHKQDGSMMSIYLSFSYEKRKEVFEKYWDIVRG